MTDESWLDPSPVGSEYERHAAAMELCAKVPVHKAFGLPAGFDLRMLRTIANTYKPKKIVVIEHGENGFEIRRLLDNADLKFFYASINTNASDVDGKTEAVLKLLNQFFELAESDISKYDPKAVSARKENCITQSYISRRLAPISAFKNEAGGIAEIKETIAAIDALTKVSLEETRELFNSDAVFYRVDRSKL